jgi:hypothetical protein
LVKAQTMDVTLDEFVTGVLAVLAYRGRTKVLLVSGPFETALRSTMDLVAKQAQREHLEFRFRVAPDALARSASNLSLTIKRLIAAGVLKVDDDAEKPAEITWTKEAAYAYLARTPVPPQFLERSAKAFLRGLETARIRRSLHRLATRHR